MSAISDEEALYQNLKNLSMMYIICTQQRTRFRISSNESKFGLQVHIFPINLAPNGTPFGAKSIGKV